MKDVAPGHIEIRASLIKKVDPLIVEPFTHFFVLKNRYCTKGFKSS